MENLDVSPQDTPCGLVIVGKRRRQVTVGVDLLLQVDDLPLGKRDRVGAGDKAARGLLERCNGE